MYCGYLWTKREKKIYKVFESTTFFNFLSTECFVFQNNCAKRFFLLHFIFALFKRREKKIVYQMATCLNLSTMKNYQKALNALSVQYSNWTTMHRIPFRWMLTKQCNANDPNQFIETSIIQTTFLASGQYLFSMIGLLMILLLFCRATTSITKDDSLAYLFKDLIAILKLLHWKNCDYSHIAFTTSCFIIFIAFLPLLLTLWLCMLCYRQYIHYTIKVSVFYFGKCNLNSFSVCVCVCCLCSHLEWQFLKCLFSFSVFFFRENMAINFVDF